VASEHRSAGIYLAHIGILDIDVMFATPMAIMVAATKPNSSLIWSRSNLAYAPLQNRLTNGPGARQQPMTGHRAEPKKPQQLLLRALGQMFVLVSMTAGLTRAQQSSPANQIARQSLDAAWWTGPMLAPSAATLPQGHFLIEPYVYDVSMHSFYDSNGSRHSAPHTNTYGSLTYVNYGLWDRLTIGAIPIVGYNEVRNAASSAGVRLGDLTLQVQYGLTKFHEGSRIPTTAIAVQETLPTGKFDRLGNRPSDGFGTGAYTTTLAFYSQTYFWMPNGRILRMRFNVLPAFSNGVTAEDVSVYGTSTGFRGHAKPGSSVFVDAAGEYSLTKQWVLALDVTYRRQGDTKLTGFNVLNPGSTPIQLDSGPSDAFGLAPAIEYNWKRNLGVLLGVRLIPAGRNTTATITPALAVNFVH
jgi:hypothetical protein